MKAIQRSIDSDRHFIQTNSLYNHRHRYTHTHTHTHTHAHTHTHTHTHTHCVHCTNMYIQCTPSLTYVINRPHTLTITTMLNAVIADQLRLMQFYTNILPLQFQVVLCCRELLLACRCAKNGAPELLTTTGYICCWGTWLWQYVDSLSTSSGISFPSVVCYTIIWQR